MFKVIFDILKKERLTSLLIIFIMAGAQTLYAQAEKKYIRQGNKDYQKNKFSESEILYRKASDKNKTSPDAVFNTGDALYKQKKYEDAGKQFIENSTMNEDKDKKSAAMYNLGNSLLQSDKLEESINAYKNSLRLNPANPEAKYNLAYAQDLLRKQQEQKQQQSKDKQDQNKDKNKNKNNKDQKDNKDNKDQNNKNNDQQKNDKQNQDQNQQQQDQQQKMTRADAERLLNAIANEEKNVQEKVQLEKAARERVKTVKNW